MATRRQIIAEARTWLGTPFHHQGRLKGVGVDCAGVVIGVAKVLNIVDVDITGYSRLPSGDLLKKHLRENMIEIDIADAKAGDVLLFSFDRDPQHVAFLTDVGILHAYMQVKKCIEHSFDDVWKSRVRGAFKFKGVR